MSRSVKTRRTAEQVRSSVFTNIQGVLTLLGLSRPGFEKLLESATDFPKAITLPGRSNPVYRVGDVLAWADRLK